MRFVFTAEPAPARPNGWQIACCSDGGRLFVITRQFRTEATAATWACRLTAMVERELRHDDAGASDEIDLSAPF
jgi:hypothetical protein